MSFTDPTRTKIGHVCRDIFYVRNRDIFARKFQHIVFDDGFTDLFEKSEKIALEIFRKNRNYIQNVNNYKMSITTKCQLLQ